MNNLTKKLIIIAILGISSLSLKGQVFNKGSKFASIGYNVFPETKNIYSTESNYSNKSFGAIHAKFEYAFSETKDKIGLGLSVNYESSSQEWYEEESSYNASRVLQKVNYKKNLDKNSLSVLLRVNIHFLKNNKIDFYSGLGLGYNFIKRDLISTNTNNGTSERRENDNDHLLFEFPLGFEATLGLRYMFTDKIGAYTEIGWAKSFIQAGLVVRF